MKKGTLKSTALSVVLTGIVAVVSTGCGASTTPSSKGGGSGNASSNSSGKAIVLKYSTADSPGSIQVNMIEKFKKEIEQSTNGKIKVQIYSSSSLYKQDAELPALEQGDLQMADISAAQLAQQMPYLSMFTAAYTFKNYNVMTKVLNGDIGKGIFQDVTKKTGVHPLAAIYLGSRELNYRNIGHDVLTPQDMKGVKLRLPDTQAWLNLGHALGGNPVPLAFTEVYTALQTGTVDAQDNPLPSDKTQKFYEVAKNISLTNHVVDSIWPTINENVWEEMTPDEQAKVQTAINDAGTYMDNATIQEESQLVTEFQKQGVKIVHPNINAFYTYAQNWYNTHPSATKGWDMSLLAKIQKMNAAAQ